MPSSARRPSTPTMRMLYGRKFFTVHFQLLIAFRGAAAQPAAAAADAAAAGAFCSRGAAARTLAARAASRKRAAPAETGRQRAEAEAAKRLSMAFGRSVCAKIT